MDMDQIRTFVAVAHARSFTSAAGSLHRSQPAISRRVELLERALGIALFERMRGRVLMTDAGTALLPFAETVLAAERDGAEAVRALRSGEAGRISLALVGTLANTTFTRVLQQFKRRHPKVRLDLQTATSQEVGNLVRRGEATLGLRYFADRSPGLLSQTVLEERLAVVGCRGHRLADGRRHRSCELAGEQWVAFCPRGSKESFAQHLERRLLAAGLGDLEISPTDSCTAQKRLVEAGFGIALVPESGIQEELQRGTLKVLDVPALRTSIGVTVVYRKNGFISPAARSLLSTIATLGKHVRLDSNERPVRNLQRSGDNDCGRL